MRILVVEDGAQSLLNMRKSGAHTIAQNEASCVVFGMPKEAIAAGGAEKVVPLSKIALTMIQCASRQGPAKPEPVISEEVISNQPKQITEGIGDRGPIADH